MSQHDRHLTTEQLSAKLDEQLSLEEEQASNAHLQSCEQCQQALKELQLLVRLLHALPQPVLPRSFALPLSAGQASVTEHRESVEKKAAEVRTKRKNITYLHTAMSLVSGLAAVIGIVFILSGLLTLSTHGMNSASSSMAPSVGAIQHSATQNSGQTFRNITTPISQKAGTRTTTAPKNEAGNKQKDQATSQNAPDGVNQAEGSSGPEQPSLPPMFLFFDLSTTGGRMGLGILLLLSGIIGMTVFLQRRKQRAEV